ncbi:MAG: sulfite exporter TauE/SafE family protein [Bdellovibrionales bacterium]|nr:sulfite exporter TauE/SafE family protein [Bdellovibrionales bacterium]
MEILGYIGAVIMGVVLGLTGGGGSILSVPIFVYLFSIPPTLATAYSLFVVGSIALIGAIQNYRQEQVDIKTGIIFAMPAFTGVFCVRKFLIPQLPDQIVQMSHFTLTRDMTIMVVFAIVMLFASVSMIKEKKTVEKANLSSGLRRVIIAVEGLMIGCVTGFVGAGGGFLIVPALVLLVGLDMKRAIGTSLMIIAVNSLIGFLGDLGHATIQWKFLISFMGLAALGILIGTNLSKKISAKKLKKAFGWFVLVMGIIILVGQIK